MSTYLLINLASISVPLVYSFHRRLNFYRTWYAFWPATVITAVFFIAWDVWFARWGVWGFNDEHLLGIRLLGLPIEEWLFFVCIPYACVFTYASLKLLIDRDLLQPYANKITVMIILLCTVLVIWKYDHLYTVTASLLTALFLALHLFWLKAPYLGRFYLAYGILLLPFFIVNGILTGTFIRKEVVWYNDAENVSVRLLTIPVEDLIYCLLLLLMNVTLYEAFLAKKAGDAIPVQVNS